jgi:hypothetical protein
MVSNRLQRTLLTGLLAAGAVALGAAVPALAASAFQAAQGGSHQSGSAQAGRLGIRVEAGLADQSVPLYPDPAPGGAISFSITNTSDVPLHVTGVAIPEGGKINSDRNTDGTAAVAGQRGTCAPFASFAPPDLATRPWPPIPPHETLKVNGSDNNRLGLGLIHLSAETPSACQGANFQVPLAVTAEVAN